MSETPSTCEPLLSSDATYLSWRRNPWAPVCRDKCATIPWIGDDPRSSDEAAELHLLALRLEAGGLCLIAEVEGVCAIDGPGQEAKDPTCAVRSATATRVLRRGPR